MTDLTLFGVSFSWIQIFILLFATMSIGANKAGIHGLTLTAIPLFGMVFGPKAGLAYSLLFNVIADAMAIMQYPLHNKKMLIKILPLAFLGIAVGTVVGKFLPDRMFALMVSSLVLFMIVLMVLPRRWMQFIQKSRVITWFFGFLGGFTSMVGNIGGPVMSTYLMAQHIDKKDYLSVFSWFFFIMNVVKVGLTIAYWHTISATTVAIDLVFLPMLFLGFWIGAQLVKKLQYKHLRIMVIGFTLLASIHLIYDALSM
jgi:uncharacterized membrane protein YfcA